MATDMIQVGLRVPDELHERIKAFSTDRELSMNQAINMLIKKGLVIFKEEEDFYKEFRRKKYEEAMQRGEAFYAAESSDDEYKATGTDQTKPH
jgi:predicted lactoylglutathione lyase